MTNVPSADELIIQANRLWAQGREDEALRSFTQLLLENPGHVHANQRFALFLISRLAHSYASRRDFENAIRAWRSYLEFEPDNLSGRTELGLLCFRQGEFGEAEKILRPLIEREPVTRIQVADGLKAILAAAQDVPDLTSKRLFEIEAIARGTPDVLHAFQPDIGSLVATRRAICVAGMHRSGTSMVANLLGMLGVHLGPQKMLVGPEQDNPDGFYENHAFVRLNQDFLSELGGAWEVPPDMSMASSAVDSIFKDRALLLAGAMAAGAPAGAPWAWKDPRSCLTLSSWIAVLPDVRVLIVVRDPGDVAQSLVRRGRYTSAEFGLVLWRQYYERLLESIGTQSCHVVQYESFFSAPRDALESICRFVGLNVTAEQLAGAETAIREGLRHNKGGTAWQSLSAGRALLPVRDKLLGMCRRPPAALS